MTASAGDPATGDTTTRRFAYGTEHHGAFGGVFGGYIAAAALLTARGVAGGRRAVALDCQFQRSLPAGEVLASARVLRSGRAVTFVHVELAESARLGNGEGAGAGGGAVAATAQAMFAADEALHPHTEDGVWPGGEVPTYDAAAEVAHLAPIMATLAPRFAPTSDGSLATLLRAPWVGLDDDATGAESACLVADMSVGPPVGALLAREGLRLATPNPDLSLRFVSEAPSVELVSVGRLVGVDSGVATTTITILADGRPVATGCSATLLLAARQ